MIRRLQKTDIDRVSKIWLDTNISAHYFINSQYWLDNLAAVKEMMETSEVYVYTDDDKILGFVGLHDNYIAGIFVSREAQSKGIGKQLLDYIKTLKNQLNLNVYQKNEAAIAFYKREKFEIQQQTMDEHTGEREYFMIWNAS